MKYRSRFGPLRRNVETKMPKSKIVIYSEGDKTERDYFEAMKRSFCSVIVDVEVIGGAGAPLTIAMKAIEAAKTTRHQNRKISYTNRDEFWAVFDRDEHPNVGDAISRCEAAKVGVAFSDPCFELWLILHFQDFDRLEHRHDVQRHLETLCADYNRTRRKTTDCFKLMSLVASAEQRAERQLRRRENEGVPPRPPFTTVYKLTRRIRAVPYDIA
jgi:hypothetical protein